MLSGNATGTPNFNRILATDVPESAIESVMITDSCGASVPSEHSPEELSVNLV